MSSSTIESEWLPDPDVILPGPSLAIRDDDLGAPHLWVGSFDDVIHLAVGDHLVNHGDVGGPVDHLNFPWAVGTLAFPVTVVVVRLEVLGDICRPQFFSGTQRFVLLHLVSSTGVPKGPAGH